MSPLPRTLRKIPDNVSMSKIEGNVSFKQYSRMMRGTKDACALSTFLATPTFV